MSYRRDYRARAQRATLKIFLPQIDELLGNIDTQADLTFYKDKPIEFAIEILKIEYLTAQQKQILCSVRDRPTTNVQAAHSVGKSFCMSLVVLWYVFAVEGMVFTTAPTLQQVKDILWQEIRQLYDRHQLHLGGSRGELYLKNSETAKAVGYTAKHTDSNAFQGRHSKNLLLIQDEADGISATIDEAFESCLTGSSNRGIRIGNPLTTGSAFFKACQLDNIKITVWQHPNVSWAYRVVVADNGKPIHRLKREVAALILKPVDLQKDNPVKPQDQWAANLPRDVIPGAVSVAWIEKVRVKYGEFSAYWVSRVEAEFPGDDIEGIIPISWLHQARSRYDENPQHWDELARKSKWRVGVDVSDGGDRHAVALWRGQVLYTVKSIQPQNDRQDTITLATDIVAPLLKSLGGLYGCAVDNTGVGAGTLGRLREMGYFASGCKFGAAANNKQDFADRKTELYWMLRDGLRLGKIAIAPLGDIEAELFEEIAMVRYNPDTEHKNKCEPKKETKKRLKRSPDLADATIIALEIGFNTQAVTPINLKSPLKALVDNAEQWAGDDLDAEGAAKYLD